MILLIVDSSPLIIERLASLVAETGKITSMYKASSYEEAGELCKEIRPDIVLLDMSLPDNKSIALCNDIRSGNRDTEFIILSSQSDLADQKPYKKLGVSIILDKYHEFEQIPFAINKIANNS